MGTRQFVSAYASQTPRHSNPTRSLTTRLPFEEDEFDHVHIQSIAQGVPENKWDNLFDVRRVPTHFYESSSSFLLQEINRVLRPGGSVEIIEDGTEYCSTGVCVLIFYRCCISLSSTMVYGAYESTTATNYFS